MSQTNEPLVTPFRIIADFREERDGWKFAGLFDAAQPERTLIVPIEYRRLEIVDYAVEGLPLYFVRKRAKELAAALRHWPESFSQEIQKLHELEAAGGSCLLVIEGSSDEIEQVLAEPKSFTGGEGGIPWLLAPSRSAAELVVFAVIQHAWLLTQNG